jgi:ferric-dicitrate binding protein FerR (iron transport regulator)
VKEKEIKKLLDKFKAGKCTAHELELLQQLMHDFDQDTTTEQPSNNLKETIWEQIENRTISTRKLRRLDTTWLKVAAVLLLTLFAGILLSRKFGYRQDNLIAYQVITAPKGQMKQIVLPDSTIVHLNAASTIKFPDKFNGKTREIYLLDGEAFFEVRHIAAQPFLVHTANVTTQVLGTSFNIKFYKELPHIQVFVNSGKVEIHDKRHTMGMYTPNQQLVYNKNDQTFVKQQVADDHSLSWMHDELVLDNVSFKEVSVYLQNRYNVSFKCNNKKLYQQHYSVRFSNKLTINQVIDILQLIDGRKYQLKGSTVNIK